MIYDRIRLTGLNPVDLMIQGAAYDDAFLLKGVDGLGPSDIDVSIAGTPDQGGYFQNKVPQNKQIIVRVGLNPYWAAAGGTPSQLRETLYGLLTGGYTGDQIAVILMNGPSTEICRIYGYVSKMETVPFSKDPQVQITIDCLSPYFTAPAAVTSLPGGTKLSPQINNTGNGPTGVYFKITFAGTTIPRPTEFTITSLDGTKKMRILAPGVSGSFNDGNTIEVNTNPGSRFITIHTSSDINGLAWLSSDSDWLTLYGSVNNFTVNTDKYNWTAFQFTPKFWGV